MIRVVMLDLGGTLVRENPLEVLPHVPAALAALNGMKTAAGEPLAVCLISNYRPTPNDVAAIFNEYVHLLDGLALTSFFQPVIQRVTLSTHTATWKPDVRVFQAALDRLRVSARWSECLLITEDADHVATARGHGMHALQFGVDFQNWEEGPNLISGLLQAAG
jgi:FMN phosphatase YigB (HAD superfamily)